jgi:hypothetical protein
MGVGGRRSGNCRGEKLEDETPANHALLLHGGGRAVPLIMK